MPRTTYFRDLHPIGRNPPKSPLDLGDRLCRITSRGADVLFRVEAGDEVMGSDSLMQKLFALEQAVGKVSNVALRTMIIEAEEAALALEREILQRQRKEVAGLPTMSNASLARDLATRGGPGPASDGGDSTADNPVSIGFRKSA